MTELPWQPEGRDPVGVVYLFSRVASASDNKINNYSSILYFLYGTIFCRSQIIGSPDKKIACLFIQDCFKCDYDLYSTVAFGNARMSL